MEVYHFRNIEKQKQGLVVGIGKFDGVHLGHKKLIEKIVSVSKKESKVASVFTFRNFPVEFFITQWEEKISILEKYGIEICIWSDFSDIRNLKANEFIEYLIKKGVEGFVVGFNFRFGKNREGDVETLKKLSEKYGFSVDVVEPVKIDGEIVNASKIRQFIKKGEIEKGNKFLGRYFSFKGKVVKGSLRGKIIGFPTANILPDYKVEAGEGVYAGYVFYKGKFYKAAINIGAPVTFGEKEKKIEVHIIEFREEIYGEGLEIFLVKRIRDVECFPSIEELKIALRKDISSVLNILSSFFPENLMKSFKGI